MQKLRHKITSQEIYTSIRDYLSEDRSGPQLLHGYLEQLFLLLPKPAMVLDLGCGEGDSIDLFRGLAEDTRWHGVDIEDSPEVKQRVRKSDLISSFNGVDLPYPDNYFDLIFSRQVIEHVRHPDALMADAFRVWPMLFVY